MDLKSEKKVHKSTFLNYVLTQYQDAVLNYLVPSVTLFLFFILLFASDVTLVFRHYKDNNPIWASLTLSLIYLPSLISYILTISSWELYPKRYGCDSTNYRWFAVKTLEHLFFPVWTVWRFAERIFWSIEAVRSASRKQFLEATKIVTAPRNIELFFFLQAFLHSLPQMLLQLNILMRQDYNIDKQTADVEILSFVFNLAKVTTTVAFYQRFKTQKLAGKQYPWEKTYKKCDHSILQVEVAQTTEIEEASTLVTPESNRGADIDDTTSTTSSHLYEQPDAPPTHQLKEIGTVKQTSVIDGPKRQQYSEPDFNLKRVIPIKGLPEDDLAGKLVAFIWWVLFLLVRILAVTTSHYFYPKETIIVVVVHIIVVIAVLIYDAKTDQVTRAKALFFLFIGLIYTFCIIEFKIKFKKTKYIYIAYFSIVFIQNFIMCCVWWFRNVDELQSDFWFRYIFYIVIGGTILSVFSMFFYLFVNKPEKIVVGEQIKR